MVLPNRCVSLAPFCPSLHALYTSLHFTLHPHFVHHLTHSDSCFFSAIPIVSTMPSQSASIKSYFSPLPSPARSSQAHSNTDNSRAEPASQSNLTQNGQQCEAGPSLSNTATTFIPGDGFTSTEMTTNAPSTGNGTQLPSLTGPFTPPHGVPYKEVMSIKHLTPTSMSEGVRFTGRVLNVYSPSLETTTATTALRRTPKGAVGYVKCTVGDGEGVIVVSVHAQPTFLSLAVVRD